MSSWQDQSETVRYLQLARLSNGRADDTFKMQFFNYTLSATNGAVANGGALRDQIP